MNLLDYLIIIALVFFGVDSLGKPFLVELINLISFLAAFLISLSYSENLSKFIDSLVTLPRSISLVIGFVLGWYLLEVIFFLILHGLFGSFLTKLKLPFDQILAILLSIFKGVIFITIIILVVDTFPVQPIIKNTVNKSLISGWLINKTYYLEIPLKNIFGNLGNQTFSFLTIHPTSGETVNLGFTTSDFNFDSDLENIMISKVNNERMSAGFSKLAYDLKLQSVARQHSAEMFEYSFFSHTDKLGLDVSGRANHQGIAYRIIGENLAFAPSLDLAHQGLMNSSGHRANILSPDYNKIGIGIAKSQLYGLMITQVFSD